MLLTIKEDAWERFNQNAQQLGFKRLEGQYFRLYEYSDNVDTPIYVYADRVIDTESPFNRLDSSNKLVKELIAQKYINPEV